MPVFRIEIAQKSEAVDPAGAATLEQVKATGIQSVPDSVKTTEVYLIEGDLDITSVNDIASSILHDPVTQDHFQGTKETKADACIEIHPLPGVMDPAGQTVELAVQKLLGKGVRVQTGRRYHFYGINKEEAITIAHRCLANTVVHGIHSEPYHPEEFPSGHLHDMSVPEVPILDCSDSDLEAMSRESHLFLNLEEMQTIQSYYKNLGRNPKEIELETLAQTWSEHCVHKTLKATIHYTGPEAEGRPNHESHEDGTHTIHNLLKSTVAAATFELIDEGIDWCLSVFVDNAGIIKFDEDHAVCFKAETHNHPSAIEPYGGAATGIGGCIRDIMGTGLSARPIAATDVFCVAEFENKAPQGCLQSRRVLSEVVRGVRDYGNRMGIPTLNGSVWFDNNYAGNPLVFCGCIGVMPIDKVEGDAANGDRIIAIGGRTGRDGIHGATFSSAELTDTHADEFSHAVQIGNAITEKQALDAILEARDYDGGCLFRAITDCGAGGFSSAVGEMGEHIGANVNLEQAPLKYTGLTPSEIWISEAQERMVLAVPPSNVEALRVICNKHGAEMCDLGEFGTEGAELVLNYEDQIVGQISMSFLHNGLPGTTRKAIWSKAEDKQNGSEAIDVKECLVKLLSHPNIASKQTIIQQYDHEVQGRSVIRPLVGPLGDAPSDGAVITPVRGSNRGLAIASGLATGLSADPYTMAAAAIDECVRNIVCVGGDPNTTAILDNFCWPSANDEGSLGRLVRCAHGCYDAAKAYRTPFISGKDSLNNQFTQEDGTTIYIPPTLLISGFGIVDDITNCVTMDAKSAENLVFLIGETTDACGGSHLLNVQPNSNCCTLLPEVNLVDGPKNARAVYSAIKSGFIQSAHDLSEGGLLIALAEMSFGGNLGVHAQLDNFTDAMLFSETPSRYLLEVAEEDVDSLKALMNDVPCVQIGKFNNSDAMTINEYSWNVSDLKECWLTGMVI